MKFVRDLAMLINVSKQTAREVPLKALETLLAQALLEQREADEWFNLGWQQATLPREVAEPVQDE